MIYFLRLLLLTLTAFLGLFTGTLVAQDTTGSPVPETEAASATSEDIRRTAVQRHMQKVSHAFSDWVDQATVAWAGAWAGRDLAFGLTPARLGAVVLIVLLVWGLSAALLSLIRKRAGTIRSVNGFGWFAMMISATRKPFVLVLWIFTAYFAFELIIDQLPDRSLRTNLGRSAVMLSYAGFVVAFFWLLFRVIRGIQTRMEKWAAQSGSRIDNLLVPVVGAALRLTIPFIGLSVLAEAVELSGTLDWLSGKLLGMFLIAGIAWLLLRAAKLTEKALLDEHRIDVEDNLSARKIYTKVSVIRKIANIIIIIVAVASILMMFDSVRQFGTSILASAGIAGIVLGLAAQKTLGNLIAGIQIAISQPIRIDDVVIVEGEWGRIEELTLTYVVVRIWDLRRLVLPINYFIERPFQNWTRTSADLLGTVFLHVDYTIPVSVLRKEFRHILDGHPLWDGKVCIVQVTDATPQTMELRLLLSTADASTGWDLRCEVREKMLAFIQKEYPGSLPRVRAEMHPIAEGFDPVSGNNPVEGSAQPGIDSES